MDAEWDVNVDGDRFHILLWAPQTRMWVRQAIQSANSTISQQ